MCGICFVIVCSLSLILLVPREGCASWLSHFLGIFTYISTFLAHNCLLRRNLSKMSSIFSLKNVINITGLCVSVLFYRPFLGGSSVAVLLCLCVCGFIHYENTHIQIHWGRPRWLSWMRRPTGDQEVAGSTPAEVGNILSWRLIMKYFLRSFSPFRWFKKGSCQFLAKECAQYWLTA